MSCDHENLLWELAPANEQGWRCDDCGERPGEPPGFSPRLDIEHLEEKIDAIVFWMNEAKLISISNSDHGFEIRDEAYSICTENNTYDSLSIAAAIIEARRGEGPDGHTEYWKRVYSGILSGKDARDRCACGQLATVFVVGGKGSRHFCSECHWADIQLVKASGSLP